MSEQHAAQNETNSTSARYRRAKKVFLAVCDLDAQERGAAIDAQCNGDGELRAEVLSLLAHYEAPTVGGGGAAGDATVAADAHRGANPRRMGPYRLIHEIGRGGMGVVYLAAREGDQLRQRVALKLLKRGMDTDDILRRFELERQVLAALNHPNIGRLYDGGESEDGRPWFAMEYIEGLPIDRYCDVHRLRISERLILFKSVCAAVHHAHQNLIVHRDLKPSNIIVTGQGVPKLLDFGIAKLINPDLAMISGDPTAPELRVMTPEYASPEQVRGEPITTASDIYSLGVLLYELVSGHRPYHLRSRLRAEIERVICEEDPERPSTAVSRIEEPLADEAGVPADPTTATVTPESVSRTREGRPDRLRRCLSGDIDNIVLMALRKETQRRYRSAEQFAEDIDRHLRGLPVIACGDTISYRLTKFVRRNRSAVAAAAMIVLLLIGGLSGTTWGMQQAVVARDGERGQRETAEREREVAAQERDRADSQRNVAEQRLGQILDITDLWIDDVYRAVQELDGALEAREMLVTAAMTHLQQLSEEVGGDPALMRRLAEAWVRSGDNLGGRRNPSHGDIDRALECYRTGLAMREALLAAAPGDIELTRGVCAARLHVADMRSLSGDVTGALAICEEALASAEALAAAHPGDEQARRVLYFVLQEHGDLLSRTGRLDAALEQFQRSLRRRREQVEQHPQEALYQRDLSSALLRIAGHRSATGDHEAALQAYLESIEVRERMVRADLDNGRLMKDLAVARVLAADEHLELHDSEAAMRLLAPAVNALAAHAAADEKDLRAQRLLAFGLSALCRAHALAGEEELALQAQRRLWRIADDLVRAEPGSSENVTTLATAHERLADLAVAGGDADAAVDNYGRALDLVAPLAAKDPADHNLQLDRGRLLRRLGAALLEAGQPTRAFGRLRDAQELYEDLATTSRTAAAREGLVETLQLLSRLALRLGDNSEALEHIEQAIEAAGERTPSLLEDLANALEANGEAERAAAVRAEAAE